MCQAGIRVSNNGFPENLRLGYTNIGPTPTWLLIIYEKVATTVDTIASIRLTVALEFSSVIAI